MSLKHPQIVAVRMYFLCEHEILWELFLNNIAKTSSVCSNENVIPLWTYQNTETFYKKSSVIWGLNNIPNPHLCYLRHQSIFFFSFIASRMFFLCYHITSWEHLKQKGLKSEALWNPKNIFRMLLWQCSSVDSVTLWECLLKNFL